MEILVENDLFEDDVDIFEIIDFGFPRQINDRAQYFHSMDELSFFRRFRLTKGSVLLVLEQIEQRLEFPYDMNNCVSPINQLLIGLRYYATGSHLLAVADFGGMHVSTACRIIKRVSEAVAELSRRYIKFPSTVVEIRQKQQKFFETAAFPRVVGTVDGTHINIQSPGGEDAEVYRNCKGYFSINVQAVSDADLKFLNIVARWPGSVHDVTLFNGCALRAEFEAGMYPNCLLLGDSGYNIRPYLLTPLLNPVTQGEQRYNESHIRTRNIIKPTFGVWKRRFPVMAYGCRLKVNNVLTVIVATAVLHNIARDMGEEEPPLPEAFQPELLDNMIEQGQMPHVPQGNGGGFDVRNTLINTYFSNM